MRHIFEVKWTIFTNSTMPLPLLWLVAHIKIFFFHVFQCLIVNWDLRRLHVKLLLFHCVIQMMMIVIIRRVRTYWYGSNILFNPRLKPSCISLSEELLLVKTKLLLLNSVNVVGVQLGKSIIHGNFLSRSVLVNLVTHEHHVHIFLRNFPVSKVERVLCSLNRSPLL